MPSIYVAYALAVLATFVAAVTDARSGRIPNWLTMPLLVAAPVATMVFEGMQGLLSSLAGIVLCAAVPLLLFLRGAMGGGDVKLFAVLGGLLGPYSGVEIQFFSYFAVAFLLLARMAWEGKLFGTLRNVLRAGGNLVLPKRFHRTLEPTLLTTMRMGLAIFCATLASLYLNAPRGMF